ncbi:MAG: hypothetical protein ACLPZR_04380 [Solirubrobacteraceae bacterium]
MIGHQQPIDEGERQMRLIEIQEQIGRGEYRVDTYAVAAAILRRLFQEQRPADAQHNRCQKECS